MTHDKIMELLPWYANETLEEHERRTVAEHLQTCAACRRELEEFRIFSDAEAALSQSAPDLPEGMLERALTRIDELETESKQSLGGRFSGWLRAWWTPTPSFAKTVLVTQFALVLGFAGLYLSLAPGPEMTTLGGGGEHPSGQTRIRVRFAEVAVEKAMREVLRSVDASIVSGPSALGVYTISLSLEPGEEEAIQKALEVLRRSEVVDYAERAP